MASNDTLKISLIADATKVREEVDKIDKKLIAFQKKSNKNAKIRISASLVRLTDDLQIAKKQLRKFKKDGDKKLKFNAQLKILGLQSNIRKAKSLLRGLDKEAKNINKSFFSLNGITKNLLKGFLGLQAVRGVLNFFSDAFRLSVEFESAFTGVRKTVNASDKDFKKLEKNLKGLSQQIPLTFQEIAGIAELGGQLGIAANDITDFTRVIAQVGFTTNVTTEDAALSFARLRNITGLTVDDLTNLASTLVFLGNNFAATEQEILDFSLRIAGAARLQGFAAQETLALATAFTSFGIKAEAGGTAVQIALQKIGDTVEKGGSQLNKFAILTGQSADQFAKQWRDEPAQAFVGFIEALGKSGAKGSQVLEELIGSNARLKRAFLAVGQDSEIMRAAIEGANISFEDATALAQEFALKNNTVGARMTRLGNRFKIFKAQLGSVGTALVFVGEFFQKLLETMTGVIQGVITLGKAFASGLGFAVETSIAFVKDVTRNFDKVAQNIKNIGKNIQDNIKAIFSGKPLKPILNLTEGIIFNSLDKVNDKYSDLFEDIKEGFREANRTVQGTSLSQQELETTISKTRQKILDLTGANKILGKDGVKNIGKVNDTLKKYTSEVDKIRSETEKLASDTKRFYGDIEDSIDGAIQKQKDLRSELDKFVGKETSSFVTKTAERDLKLKKSEKDIRQDIADEEQRSTSSFEDRIDKQNKINELNQKLNKILDERNQIRAFISDQGAGGEFQRAQERANKSQFEQDRLSFQERIDQKTKEVNAEIEKQKKIAEVQTRFQELLSTSDAKELRKRRDLFKLVGSEQADDQEALATELEKLGFEDLDREQQLQLLKQVEKVKGLEIEQNLIRQQQDDILKIKNDFLARGEEAFKESVDRQITDMQRLITAIQSAQLEQVKLNDLRQSGATNLADRKTTQNVNINQTISGEVDMEAANRNLIRKVK